MPPRKESQQKVKPQQKPQMKQTLGIIISKITQQQQNSQQSQQRETPTALPPPSDLKKENPESSSVKSKEPEKNALPNAPSKAVNQLLIEQLQNLIDNNSRDQLFKNKILDTATSQVQQVPKISKSEAAQDSGPSSEFGSSMNDANFFSLNSFGGIFGTKEPLISEQPLLQSEEELQKKRSKQKSSKVPPPPPRRQIPLRNCNSTTKEEGIIGAPTNATAAQQRELDEEAKFQTRESQNVSRQQSQVQTRSKSTQSNQHQKQQQQQVLTQHRDEEELDVLADDYSQKGRATS